MEYRGKRPLSSPMIPVLAGEKYHVINRMGFHNQNFACIEASRPQKYDAMLITKLYDVICLKT